MAVTFTENDIDGEVVSDGGAAHPSEVSTSKINAAPVLTPESVVAHVEALQYEVANVP